MVVEAQAKSPMAAFWGMGTTASSDGQFFSTTRQGGAMNLINAKYGREPGLKAYTHVSDQFAPFAIQTIPATVSEAPYILDGLLMNETGKRIREQYTDTGGFTDHVLAPLQSWVTNSSHASEICPQNGFMYSIRRQPRQNCAAWLAAKSGSAWLSRTGPTYCGPWQPGPQLSCHPATC